MQFLLFLWTIISFICLIAVFSSVVITPLKNSGPYTLGILTSNSSYLIMGTNNNILTFCEFTQTMTNCPYSLTTSHSGRITTSQISNDDILIATGGIDYQLFVYYVSNKTLKCTFTHNAQVKSIKFDPSNRQILYSGGDDMKVIKWNTTSCLKIIENTLLSSILLLNIKPDGQQILVGASNPSSSSVYRLSNTLTIISTYPYSYPIISIFYTGNNNQFVIITEAGNLVLMDSSTIVATQPNVFSQAPKYCNQFGTQTQSSSIFYICCIDDSGYVRIYKITTTTITEIYTYQTSYTSIKYIIGKQISPLIISFTISYQNQLVNIRIDDSTNSTSCSLYFYMNSTRICNLCYTAINNCLKCSSASTCTTCMDGYYSTGSACTKCASPCSLCSSSNNCDACYTGYQLQGSNCQLPNTANPGCLLYEQNNHKCLSCSRGYYLQSNNCNLCSSAINSCIQCSSSTACSSCLTLYYLTASNSCNLCNNTIPGCKICSDNNNCIQCYIAFKNISTFKKCSSCHATCLTCLQYYNQCGSCRLSDNRTLSQTSCLCNYGYIELIIDNPCVACSDYLTYCQTCSSQTVCTLCINHFYFIVRSGKTQCQKCISTCATCSITYNNCTSCDLANYHRVLSGASCVCQAGYIDKGILACYGCFNLIVGCLSCSNSTYCTLCDSGYIINNVNASYHNCIQCSYQCSTCSVINGTNVCNSCPVGSFRTYNSTSHSCPCDSGYFDQNTIQCSQCSTLIPNCLTCRSRTYCLSCSLNLYPDRTHQYCYSCSSLCASCGLYYDSCTACRSDTLRVIIGDKCICNNSYYSVPNSDRCESCQSSIPNCITCQNSNICSSCTTGYSLSQNQRQCLSCSTLINGCLSCINSTSCLQCISPFIQINHKCVCPSNSYTSKKDLGTCKNYKIMGLMNQMKLQIQIHQHSTNQIIIFIRFHSFDVIIVNKTLNESIRILIDDVQYNKVIFQSNNKVIATISVDKVYIKPQIKIIFSNNTFYNSKLQNLNNLQYKQYVSRVYYYSSDQIQSNPYVLNTVNVFTRIMKWIAFILFILGFIKLIFPILVFLQIVPLYLFLVMSLPADLHSFLQGLLSFQFQSLIPLENTSLQILIPFPPLTLDYYNIRNYLITYKILDILIICFIIIITKFDKIVINMFPQGLIKTYIKDMLIKKGYSIRSLSILLLQPSFISLASIYLLHKQFSNFGQILNYIICIFIFGLYLVYNFNHASTLKQTKLIKNIDNQDCFLGLDSQIQQSFTVILIIQISYFWMASGLFIVNSTIYFCITLGIHLISIYYHLSPKLYRNYIQMSMRIISLLSQLLFTITIFVFNLSQWNSFLTIENSKILGKVSIASIIAFISFTIIQKIFLFIHSIYKSKSHQIANQAFQKENHIQKKVIIAEHIHQLNDKEIKIKQIPKKMQTKSNLKYIKSSKNINDFLHLRQTKNNKNRELFENESQY